MHRITLPDGTTRKSNTLRIALASAYFMMGAAGAFLFYSPIFTDKYSWRIEIMAVFLVVGGLSSLIGTITSRWVGEFTGLPLLAAAFAVFGLVTVRQSFEVSILLAFANGFLMWSVTALIIARWRVSLAFYRVVVTLGKGNHRHD